MTDTKPFIAGTCTGVIGTIFGHPMDTIKTRYQVNKSIRFNRYLYRGIGNGIIIAVMTNSFTFGASDNLNRYCDNYYLSGFVTGLLTGALINTSEYNKIQAQCNGNGKWKLFVTRGIGVCMVREGIALSSYFGLYHQLRDRYNPIFSGALTGSVCWLVSYPVDTIKTQYQTNINLTYHQIIRSLTWQGTWKGIGWCMMRSALVNAMIFPTYEYMMRFLSVDE